MNVASLLESARLRYGDRLAVSDASRSLNYSEYSARAEAVATALRSSGLGSSHRVAVLLHNSVEYAEVIFGIALAGLTAVHISYRLTPAEMAYLLENSNVGMIIYDK
ncbi:MAG: AMP-binding protein, partial [Actinobacteria bacterium]|nr:AMP-binding protein [Actinomycetota bacterium]